jgi:GWxTD domain-containing protein
MKAYYTFAILFLFVSNAIYGLEVSVSYAAFKGEKENYIEFYFYIVGSSVKQIQVDSINSQATVAFTTNFLQNGKVVKTEKFNLKSPPSLNPQNFYEMRRYAIENGSYDIEIHIKDTQKEAEPLIYKSNIIINYGAESLRQSDIVLLSNYRADSSDSKYVKNGYFLEALPFTYYDRTYKQLVFYNELYNTDKFIGEDFLMSYTIENIGSSLKNTTPLIGHKRKQASPYIANLISMDISNLPSGNYRLIVSIRNRNNDLLSQKETIFQRSNPELAEVMDTITNDALQNEFVGQMDIKTLQYSLKSITMNVAADQTGPLKDILANSDTLAKRRFLYGYWYKINPAGPEMSYDQYMMVAKAVDNMYNNGFGYGFETDRGRVYMLYGRPNDILTVENEMNAPPYEVWIYNKIEKTQQTGVKFLFYNPNLTPNGHRLLHSNCRGETNNPRWVRELYKNVQNELPGNNIDNNEVKSNFNRRAVEIFNDN